MAQNRHLQAPVQYTPFLDERPLGSVAVWLESKLAITSGAVATGTANSDVLNSLIDGSASFTTTVATGFIVHNTTDDIFAKVTSVTNNSTLVLDYDAFPAGTENYAIYRNPAIPDGWAPMDGSTLVDTDSRFNGQTIGNWNAQDFVTKNYNTGWVSNSDWTNIEITVNHGLAASFEDLHYKFMIRLDTGEEADVLNTTFRTGSITTSEYGGVQVFGIDNNSFKIQTGAQGFFYLEENGNLNRAFDSTGITHYYIHVSKPSKFGTSENESVQLLFKHKAPRVATAGKLSVEDLTVTRTINGSSTITQITNDYTVSAAERIIYANPIDNDIDITIPSDYPEGFPLKVVNKYDGYGRVVDGDCESATSPSFTGGATPVATNATWSRDTGDSFKGSSSYRLTVTTGGSEGYINLTGTTDQNQMRGFVAGETYTIQTAIKPVTVSIAAEATLRLYYYESVSAAWHFESSNASSIGEWQIQSVTKTLPLTTTGVIVRIVIQTSASSGEYILADEIKAWRHHLTTITPPAGALIGNGSYLGMSNNSCRVEVSKYNSNDFALENFTGLSGNVRLSSSPLTITHNFGSGNYMVDVSPVSNEAGFLGEFGAFNLTPTTFQIYYTGSSDTVDMGWHLRPI